MQSIVSIDLGSNSFRVLLYDCENYKILDEYNEVVGMADGLNKSGVISQAAQIRVVNAIKKSIEKINYDPKEVVAVTTAAMRMAKNSQDVLEYFKEKTGVDFKIIDGVEEARLTLLAVQYALKREKIASSNFVLLDIGGGSTEIIVNRGSEYFSKSFNFGIVTLTQRFDSQNELLNQLDEYKKDIGNFLKNLNIDLKLFVFVATAGTPTTIAAIKLEQDFFNYDREKINGSKVNLLDLKNCLEIFKNESKENIIKLVGKGRVEFIEVGILIYRTIFEALEKEESIVLDDGLREGVAIDYCIKNCN